MESAIQQILVILKLMFTRMLPILFVITLTEALTKLMVAGVLSHLLLLKGNSPMAVDTPNQGTQPVANGKPTSLVLRAALRRTVAYAWRISLFVSVITVAVFYMERLGIFQMLPIGVDYIGLPDEFNTTLYAYMGNAYAGMGMIGAILMEHRLNTLEAINLLVFCMMYSRPIVMIKESPSYYFGLYGPANDCLLILFHLGVFIPLCFLVLWLVRMV